jgi:HAD superfamily hydrolase (TIGR01490 family)
VSKAAAFFDLDGTLLTVNTARLWMKREQEAGRITRWQLVQGVVFLLAYKLGVVDMERATETALATIRGFEEDQVRAWSDEWYEVAVVPHAAPGAWPVLASHRAQGQPLVLLTTSSPYAGAAAQRQFDLDHVLSMRYEVVDGRFTGGLVKPICFGEGKVAVAERWAAEHDVDLDASSFYTDSITDRPMLERVGHPFVVNPDPRLQRLALRRGWPVLDWACA